MGILKGFAKVIYGQREGSWCRLWDRIGYYGLFREASVFTIGKILDDITREGTSLVVYTFFFHSSRDLMHCFEIKSLCEILSWKALNTSSVRH